MPCYCLFLFPLFGGLLPALIWVLFILGKISSFMFQMFFSETVYSGLFFKNTNYHIWDLCCFSYLGFLILLFFTSTFCIIFLTSSHNLVDLGSFNDEFAFHCFLCHFLKCCKIIVHFLNIFLSIAHSFVNLICCSRTSFFILFLQECLIFPHSVENWFTQNFHLFYGFSFQKHTLHISILLCLSHSLSWWSFCLCLLFHL